MTDLLVLHALRCMGFTDLERVADTTGLSTPEAESRLIDLAVAGLVTRIAGPFGGWGVTQAGKAEDARLIAEELATAGSRPAVASAYEAFLLLNPELLDLCSAWHMRTVSGVAEVNDHSDAAYDGRVLIRFTDLDSRAAPVCVSLTTALPRFSGYRARLATALARAESGEREHLTDTTTSYHAVWFQLHEDLLVTLGIPR
ncbi:transcriptional regulator [Actinoplanes derwentensis]|uniref:Uncharacterized protein n=1 Tax=Actinoplanes derwentensis TaxID=113562 RepID=A0A1H1ZAR0_9ACTN|nr:transcriptional regulator [Actinoplanes derwentensis]GID82345.1 hypothetical protein Ade03nite_12690 [Actinoplanes derwentensis]SDT30885.1 hypothetical protein SAMN04489716_3231 [Actinoplanes derwentensis]